MPNPYHFRFPDLAEERRTFDGLIKGPIVNRSIIADPGEVVVRHSMQTEWKKWGTPEARDRGRIAAAGLGLRLNLPEKPKDRLNDEANKWNLDLVRTFLHQPADALAEDVWMLLERSAGAGAAVRSRVDKQRILHKAGREKERDEARIKVLETDGERRTMPKPKPT